MAAETIVVIEDEPKILKLLQANLHREGFRVFSASNGNDGLRLIRRERPDLVLLDLLLPGADGLDVCRRLRSSPETRHIPIIIVTGKGDESDVVLGLGVGADDYVAKPFRTKELVARVKAVLRRSRSREEEVQQRLHRGPVTIESEQHRATVDGKPIRLTPTEFRLLQALASYPGKVFSRQQLVTLAIGEGAEVAERNIDVHVRALRLKLGTHRDLIVTVPSVGYSFSERLEDRGGET